jgi:hypothetical protein
MPILQDRYSRAMDITSYHKMMNFLPSLNSPFIFSIFLLFYGCMLQTFFESIMIQVTMFTGFEKKHYPWSDLTNKNTPPPDLTYLIF